MAVELATGYVSLAVSTKGVGGEINRMFNGIDRQAAQHGEKTGSNFSKGFNKSSNKLLNTSAFINIARTVKDVASKGMPDLSFGMEKVARKATLLTGALTSVVAAGAPVIAWAGGLATALGTAGAGLGAFGALVAPAFVGMAEGVTKATDAQKKYDAAVAAGDKEGATKALEARKAAFEGLTPAQKAATNATLDFKKAFVDQSKAFATPALEIYTKGIKTLQGLLPALAAIAQPVSDSLVAVFERANTAARGQGMADFVTFMVKNVGPAVDGVLDLVINLGATLGNVFKAAAPGAALALEIFDELFRELRLASEGSGLKKFFEDMQVPMIQVGRLISNVVGFVGDLIGAATPLASTVLAVVNDLVDALRDLVSSKDFAGFVSNIGGILEAVAPLFNVLAGALGKIAKVLSDQLLALMPTLVPLFEDFVNALADVLVGISPLLGPLAELVGALVAGLLPVLYPIITLLRKGLVPAVELLTDGIKTITPYVDDFVDGLVNMANSGDGVKFKLPAMFDGIRTALTDMWAVVKPIFQEIGGAMKGAFLDNLPGIRDAVASLKEVWFAFLDLTQARIEQFTKAVKWIWDHFGDNIIGVFKAVFKMVVGIVGPALKIIASIFKLFTNLIRGNWKAAWGNIVDILKNIWKIIFAVLRGAFGILKALWWDTLKKIYEGVQTRLGQIRDRFQSIVSWIKGGFRRSWETLKDILMKPVEAGWKLIDKFLGKVRAAFKTTRDNIKKVWDGVKSVVKNPIDFVRENVYNKILVPVWNRVAGLVNGTKLNAYARGGVEPEGIRPGYTPGRDTHVIAVGGGEAIMRPEWTKAVGAGFIHLMNRIARSRGVQGVKKFLNEKGIPAFAGGGVVDWFKDKIGGVGNALSGIGGKLKDWVLGGLAKAASAVFAPLRKLIDSNLRGSTAATTTAKVANKALDLVIDKIKSVDVAPDAGPGGDPGGPAMGGGRNRVRWKGGTFTERFRNTLIRAQRLAGRNIPVYQGGFSRAVRASGTSHYGDAIDTLWNSSILSGLRRARVAAWHRTPAQGFVHHIHGVPLPGAGFPGGSGIWQAQDYLRGGNGLASGGLVAYDPMRRQLTAQSGLRVSKFDTGGWLEPGVTLAVNNTRKRERVSTGDQGDSPLIGSLTLVSRNDDPKEDMDAVAYKLRVLRRGGGGNYRGVA